jgi:hypothetical protein
MTALTRWRARDLAQFRDSLTLTAGSEIHLR